MAKIIDDETMENVCILAKLSLSEEEKEKAKAEMQKMLDYVEKLDELQRLTPGSVYGNLYCHMPERSGWPLPPYASS